MASGLALYLPPIVAVIFLAVFARALWRQQANSTADRNDPTGPHSERAYKNFEFFITVSLAIVGGLGYVRLEYFDRNEAVARQAMFGLGLLALTVAIATSLLVIIHQGSKLRRWPNIEWEKSPFWLELWMCIVMMAVGTMIWLATNIW